MATRPAAVDRLEGYADEYGYTFEVEESTKGVWRQRHEDGSTSVHRSCPTCIVTVTGHQLGAATGWIKNPLTNRWCLTSQAPVFMRIKQEDEYPDAVSYQLNRALELDIIYWETSLSDIERVAANGEL